jgi:ParB/RepB/Spo0J family partition protein
MTAAARTQSPAPVTPFALENEPLIRLLAEGWPDTKTALGKRLGRDLSNLNKTLLRLQEDGIVEPGPLLLLTDAGKAAVAAMDRMRNPPPQGEGDREAVEGVSTAPAGYVELIWMQIDPDPLNPRKHFDDESIDELAASIARDGLLENLVVRPGVVPDEPFLVDSGGQGLPMHRLVAGERRHRAIKRLIERGVWPADRAIVCKVVEIDDADHRRIALVENLQRKDLRPIDEAQALKELMAVTSQGTAEIAAEIGFTQRFVQQRLQLLDLPPIKQVELQEGKITIEDARRHIQKQNIEREAAEKKRLPRDELLAMAEILDVIAHDPTKLPGCFRGDVAPIGYRGLEAGEPIARLAAKGFLAVIDGWRDDPRHFVSVQWPMTEKDIEQQLPGWRGKDRLRVFRALRCQVLGADEGHRISDTWKTLAGLRGEYATWALNAPFCEMPDPALEAAAETHRQRETERGAQEFDRRCAEIQERQRQQAFLDAVRQLDEHPTDSNDEFRVRFADVWRLVGVEGPWSLVDDNDSGMVTDAHGNPNAALGKSLEARRRLMVMALNFAAGFETFSGPAFGAPETIVPAEPEDEDDEDQDIPPALRRLAGAN